MQEEQPAPSGGAEVAATPAAAPAPASTPQAPGAPAHPPRPAGQGDEAMGEADEDEALQLALQMSMQDEQPPSQVRPCLSTLAWDHLIRCDVHSLLLVS